MKTDRLMIMSADVWNRQRHHASRHSVLAERLLLFVCMAQFRVIRTSSFPRTRESSERNMRRLAQLLPAIVTRWIVVLNGAHVTNIRVRIGINCRSAHVTSWNQIPECG